MHTRRIILLGVMVSLSIMLVLVTATRSASAMTRSNNHKDSVRIVQPARSTFVDYAGVPAYDSGWESLSIRPDPISVAFTHNLGGDPDTYQVSLECRDDTTLGTYDCTNDNFNVQAHWYGLTDTAVSVYVNNGSQPDGVRVRIYAGAPAYDSGWESLSIRPDPISVAFTHNLGGDPDTYQVSLECRDDTTLGTYDCTNDNFNVQAHWSGLTSSIVYVFVSNGSQPDGVRVRIYPGAPAYDSGWESLSIRPDPISVGFSHNLGGNPNTYQVSLECRDNTTLATYDCTNDNFHRQAHWNGVTASVVNVFVSGGSQPDDVRIRIWRFNAVYLPIVGRPAD